MLLLLLACADPDDDDARDDSAAPPAPLDVAWSPERAPLDETSPTGRPWRRGIVHLHSHYSHDACDGEPMPDGVPDEACLADLRAALCDNAIDYAFLTDHPAHAASQPYEDLLLVRDGDEVIDGIANRMACPNGQRPLLMPGIEDELMPVGLDAHAGAVGAEAEAIYGAATAASIDAERAAGALVLQAHTESQALRTLEDRQAAGLAGVELFNLHAMVDPDIRAEALGLDATDWLGDVGTFLTGQTDAEPDLVFLGFYQEQAVSIERWEALGALGPVVATAGTDAHQNALPMAMADGERVDSYRRMIRWFSNVLLVDDDSPAAHQEALAAARLFVAFEALGTPTGFDVRYGALEMGGSAPVGETLTVGCPTLAPTSPQRGEAPVITVQVLKDGQPWQTGCGAWTLTEPGLYRVRVDIEPRHLAAFLDDKADWAQRSYPWLYSNLLRVGLDAR